MLSIFALRVLQSYLGTSGSLPALIFFRCKSSCVEEQRNSRGPIELALIHVIKKRPEEHLSSFVPVNTCIVQPRKQNLCGIYRFHRLWASNIKSLSYPWISTPPFVGEPPVEISVSESSVTERRPGSDLQTV